MWVNGFVVSMYLFPQSGPPSDESLEVTLSENFQILTVRNDVWCCQVKVTPSETAVSDAAQGVTTDEQTPSPHLF